MTRSRPWPAPPSSGTSGFRSGLPRPRKPGPSQSARDAVGRTPIADLHFVRWPPSPQIVSLPHYLGLRSGQEKLEPVHEIDPRSLFSLYAKRRHRLAQDIRANPTRTASEHGIGYGPPGSRTCPPVDACQARLKLGGRPPPGAARLRRSSLILPGAEANRSRRLGDR